MGFGFKPAKTGASSTTAPAAKSGFGFSGGGSTAAGGTTAPAAKSGFGLAKTGGTTGFGKMTSGFGAGSANGK